MGFEVQIDFALQGLERDFTDHIPLGLVDHKAGQDFSGRAIFPDGHFGSVYPRPVVEENLIGTLGGDVFVDCRPSWPQSQPFGIDQFGLLKVRGEVRGIFRFVEFQEVGPLLGAHISFISCGPVYNLIHLSLILRFVETKFGFLVMGILIPGIVEKGKGLVVLFVPDGVVGVAVALHTGHGGTLPHFKGGIDPIQNGGHTEFFIFGSPLVIVHRVAVKSRGRELILCRVGQQIPCQLLNCKLVKRLVGIERTNHPISVGPKGTGDVSFIAFGIRIACEVKPPSSPFFTIGFCIEQLIHGLFVGDFSCGKVSG